MPHFKTIAATGLLVLALGAAAQAADTAKPADKPHHSRFEALDANKDGGVTLAELKAGLASHPRMLEHADKLFTRLDANKDGKVTKDEFKAKRRGHRHHGDHAEHTDKK